MNKHNTVYFVLFGNDRYKPDLHFRACRHKFDHLPDARQYTKPLRSAYIFKAYFPKGQDFPYITEVR